MIRDYLAASRIVLPAGSSILDTTSPSLALGLRAGRSTRLKRNFKEVRDMETEAIKIAKLNDVFRRSGFGIRITPGVQALEDLVGLLDEIRRFDTFTEDNDPYGEHDFGTVYWYGEKVFFKIDYYDQSLHYGRHPLEAECRRMMTVMLASEY
jgi:hypothetical protein